MMIARRALLGGLAALPLVNRAAAWQAAPAQPRQVREVH